VELCQKTVLRELLTKNQAQVPDLVVALRVTEQAVRKDLAKLTKLELVEKRGAARHPLYLEGAVAVAMNPQLSSTTFHGIRNLSCENGDAVKL
jgi:DeoR/GlpR family transcriptional regulator of sugar metabolism